jgi:hypothetical protein
METTSTSSVMAAAQNVSVSVARFKRHVAIHQEELAIIALPRGTEETETPASGSAAAQPSIAPSVSSSEGEELKDDCQDPAEETLAPGNPVQEQAQPSNSGKLVENEAQPTNNQVLWCEFSELLGCETTCTSNRQVVSNQPPSCFSPNPQH